MLYFTIKLAENSTYNYEVDKISYNIEDFNTKEIIFYTSENLNKGDIIDFWELKDYDVYSGYVYKILDSNKNIATVIDYDDIYDVINYEYTNMMIVVRIEQLFYDKKEIIDIFERTSEILCDICEIDIPIY